MITKIIDGKFEIQVDTHTHRGVEQQDIVIANIVSGKEIPEDEPMFLLRARDEVAIGVLKFYLVCCKDNGCNDLHLAGIKQVIDRFEKFTTCYPERMKEPGKSRHLRLDNEQT
jgi:hypothetical protein